MPDGLKIFLMSLTCGALGGYAAFRVAYWLALKLARGDYREILAMGIAVLAALLIGTASAVTAGVLAGRNRR